MISSKDSKSPFRLDQPRSYLPINNSYVQSPTFLKKPRDMPQDFGLAHLYKNSLNSVPQYGNINPSKVSRDLSYSLHSNNSSSSHLAYSRVKQSAMHTQCGLVADNNTRDREWVPPSYIYTKRHPAQDMRQSLIQSTKPLKISHCKTEETSSVSSSHQSRVVSQKDMFKQCVLQVDLLRRENEILAHQIQKKNGSASYHQQNTPKMTRSFAFAPSNNSIYHHQQQDNLESSIDQLSNLSQSHFKKMPRTTSQVLILSPKKQTQDVDYEASQNLDQSRRQLTHSFLRLASQKSKLQKTQLIVHTLEQDNKKLRAELEECREELRLSTASYEKKYKYLLDKFTSAQLKFEREKKDYMRVIESRTNELELTVSSLKSTHEEISNELKDAIEKTSAELAEEKSRNEELMREVYEKSVIIEEYQELLSSRNMITSEENREIIKSRGVISEAAEEDVENETDDRGVQTAQEYLDFLHLKATISRLESELLAKESELKKSKAMESLYKEELSARSNNTMDLETPPHEDRSCKSPSSPRWSD